MMATGFFQAAKRVGSPLAETEQITMQPIPYPRVSRWYEVDASLLFITRPIFRVSNFNDGDFDNHRLTVGNERALTAG